MPFFEIFRYYSEKRKMETIKDRVVSLCERDGITVSELEAKLELGNGAVDKWKKHKPRPATVAKLAEFFNVTTDYLYNGNQAIIAVGQLETDLLKKFRMLNEVGKYKILLSVVQELAEEQKDNQPETEEIAESSLSAG